jgi:hypothetical protein
LSFNWTTYNHEKKVLLRQEACKVFWSLRYILMLYETKDDHHLTHNFFSEFLKSRSQRTSSSKGITQTRSPRKIYWLRSWRSK